MRMPGFMTPARSRRRRPPLRPRPSRWRGRCAR
jgi:hypothetical protein